MILFLLLASIPLPNWSLPWNMYDVSTNPEFCKIGYGDWADPSQGAHKGIDFEDPFPGYAAVYSPPFVTYVAEVYESPGPGGVCLILGHQQEDEYGWAIQHINYEDAVNRFYLDDLVPPSTFIGRTQTYSASWWFRHIHVTWKGFYQPTYGIVNPLDYIIAPSGYDDVSFRQIPSIYEAFCNQSRGIIFDIQDDKASLDETGDVLHWHDLGPSAYKLFQREIYGRVDFIVSPASVDIIPPISATTAGVRSLVVDVVSMEGTGYKATQYGERTAYDCSSIIPHGENPEGYYGIFFDPPPHPQDPDLPWLFNTTFQVT